MTIILVLRYFEISAISIMSSAIKPYAVLQLLTTSLSQIDEDNSGFIDQAELKEVLRTSLNIEASKTAIAFVP